MNPDALLPAIVIGVLLVRGILATWWLRQDYRAVKPLLVPRYQSIGRAFVIASLVVVIALGWFAIVTARRLLGFEAFDWTPIVSWIIVMPALLLPDYLWRVWRMVGSDPSHPPRRRTKRSRSND